MDRRHFLKDFGLLATAALFPVRGVRANEVSLSSTSGGFQLIAITDRPEALLPELQAIVKAVVPQSVQVAYAESRLPGRHQADLTVIRDNALLDFYREPGEVAAQLRKLVRSLNMPHPVDDPYLLKIYEATPLLPRSPRSIEIYRENQLLDTLPLQEERDEVVVVGHRGKIVLRIAHGRARITHADCRHKTCMSMGSIGGPGEHLVCIPNRIRIAVNGANPQKVDGIVY